MNRVIAIAAAAALGATFAGQAAAQSGDTVRVSVSYADLDLSRASGREALEHRIDSAIDRICADEPSPVDLNRTHVYRVCRAQAWAGARQQLAAVYGGATLAQAAIRIGFGKR